MTRAIAELTVKFEDTTTEAEQFELIEELFSRGFKVNLQNVKYSQRIGKKMYFNKDLVVDYDFCKLSEGVTVKVPESHLEIKQVKVENEPMKVLFTRNTYGNLGDFDLLSNTRFQNNLQDF